MHLQQLKTHCICRRAICLPSDEDGTPCIVPVHLHELDTVSSMRIYIPKDLRQPDARALGIKVTPAHMPVLTWMQYTEENISRPYVHQTAALYTSCCLSTDLHSPVDVALRLMTWHATLLVGRQ